MFKKPRHGVSVVADIDDFASKLLDEAKRFLEKAAESTGGIASEAFLHASLMLGFSALEAHVNSVADEIAPRPGFTVHERALLLEQEVRLENGAFKMAGLRMVRLEDRILFLHHRLAGKPLDKSDQWWGDLTSAIALRNRLTHPKGAPNISIKDVQRAIEAIIFAIDAIYKAVFGKPFPFLTLGLHSQMSF
jgi:hypothetical protein